MTTRAKNKRRLRIAAVVGVLLLAGGVFATTSNAWISIFVDTEGKTDQEVEDEVYDQLIDNGIQNPEVEYRSNGNQTKLKIGGELADPNGGVREFKVVQKKVGEGGGTIEVEVEPLDTEREPGMTDQELEEKIRAQLEARGMTGHVKVRGDEVEIRARKEVDCEPGSGDCPGE